MSKTYFTTDTHNLALQRWVCEYPVADFPPKTAPLAGDGKGHFSCRCRALHPVDRTCLGKAGAWARVASLEFFAASALLSTHGAVCANYVLLVQ